MYVHVFVSLSVCLKGTYAVVEFANREGILSLHEATTLPSVLHEASVPFKSRLLSLRGTGMDQSTGPASLKLHPHTAPPVNDLIQRLSAEESVS